MKRPHKVEFYIAAFRWQGGFGDVAPREYSWRLKAPNNKIIQSPHETFDSHRNAVESFRRVADAIQCAEGTVFEVESFDKDATMKMLCRK